MSLNRIFNYQTKTVGSAGLILAISALISRFLGVVRDWLLARSFGAGAELDIYFTAFKIPDFIYNVLILGGALVAFLPLFSEYFVRERKEAWKFSTNCLNIFLLLLVSVSILLFIFTPSLIKLIAPGFDFEKIKETIILTRIMFLSPIFLGLSSIFSGILQYFNRFLVYSLCPILYNLGIIFGILILSPNFGILGVAFGVILGALLHLLIQIPSALDCGFSFKPILDFKDKKIKKVFVLMAPRAVGVSASQINLVLINAIASTLAEGSISIFNFANNIQYFPIGIIGTSFAMAAFPAFSKIWAEREKKKFTDIFSLVFRQILYLVIPVSFLIFILRNQIVDVILRHGHFSLLSARLTSASLALFCFGIFASSLIPLFFRAFFSLKDTKTPTLIAVIFMGINVILSLFLTQSLKLPHYGLIINFKRFLVNNFSLRGIDDISVLGLPLAFSISSIFQFILFFIFLIKRMGDFNLREIFNSFSKIFLSSILMILAVYFILFFINAYFGILIDNFWQIIIASFIGLSLYFLITFVLQTPEIKGIKNFFLKKD
jgi:putative peptidoglycan lipid II flippase